MLSYTNSLVPVVLKCLLLLAVLTLQMAYGRSVADDVLQQKEEAEAAINVDLDGCLPPSEMLQLRNAR